MPPPSYSMDHIGSVRASKRQRHQLKRQLAAADKEKEHAQPEIPMAKSLASSEKRERDRALAALAAFLSSGKHIPESEMLRLWKGLFQSFYHSDKPLVQQVLADELAQLVLVIGGANKDAPVKSRKDEGTTGKKRKQPATSNEPSIEQANAALSFLEAFWDTMTNDYQGLDKHRVSKFLLLMRRFWAAGLRLMHAHSWDPTLVARWAAILTKQNAQRPGGPLSPTDLRVPASIPLHIADIAMEEMDRFVETLGPNHTKVDILSSLAPFLTVLRLSPNDALFTRILQKLIQPLMVESLRLAEAAKKASSAPEISEVSGGEEAAQAEAQAVQAEAQLAAASSHVPLLLASTLDTYLSERGPATFSGPEAQALMAAAERDAPFLKTANLADSFTALHDSLAKSLFDAAAQADTRGANRNKLYRLLRRTPKSAAADDGDW